MEDILKVYHRVYDPILPVVCFDEATKQILSDLRDPLPMSSGQPERVDNEYIRQGSAAIFMAFEPLAGKRSVFVRDRRTAKDFAQVVKYLVMEQYATVSKIILVLDNAFIWHK